MKKTLFQFVLITALIFGIIIAVLIFAGIIKVPGSKNSTAGLSGTVVIWGTLSEDKMASVITPISKDVKTYKIEYVEKRESTYEIDLVEALASGKGPDIVIIDPGLLIKQSDKIKPTAFKTFSERDYKDTFVSVGDLFLSPNGILAFPISVNPMVLYYNKDILDQEGVPLPPAYWSDLISLAPKLSKVDENGILTKSMVALGEYDNVTHAKDIFAMMVLQLGNPIIDSQIRTSEGVSYFIHKAVIDTSTADGVRVGESVLRFYTEFADPAKQTYSWNKTFGDSKGLFIGGKLPFYFGFASEYTEIQEKNPNLRFDISKVPQIRADYPIKATYGQVQGVALLNSSKNPSASYNAMQYLISPNYSSVIAEALGTAPARRDALAIKQESAYKGVVYPSAIIARGWLDPNEVKTNEIFKRMITGAVSGRSTLTESVRDFVNSMNDMLP